jgi:hypothetical protein
VVVNDNVSLITSGATGAFSDPNTGTNKTVQVSGLTLSGTSASNYTLTQPSTTASITQLTPAFVSLSANQGITYGTSTVALSGKLTGSPVNPPAGSTVTITVNGAATNTATNDAAGDFSVNVATSGLNASTPPYTITYSYTATTNFAAASDNSTAVTVNKATPVFSNLIGGITTYGSTTLTTLSGTIKSGTLIPSGNVSITDTFPRGTLRSMIRLAGWTEDDIRRLELIKQGASATAIKRSGPTNASRVKTSGGQVPIVIGLDIVRQEYPNVLWSYSDRNLFLVWVKKSRPGKKHYVCDG